MKTIRYLLLALLFSAPAMASEISLTIGVKSNIPPMAYMDKGVRKGFEIAFTRALAGELEKLTKKSIKLRLKTVTTEDRFDLLNSGKVDYLVATVSRTKSREMTYTFSDPYFYTDLVLISNKNDIRYQDLHHLTLAALKHSTSVGAASSIHGARVILVDDLDELVDQVRSGKADAIVIDATFLHAIRSQLGKTYNKELVLGKEVYGVVAGKKMEKDALTKIINQAIANLRKRGVIRQLADRYHVPYTGLAPIDLKM